MRYAPHPRELGLVCGWSPNRRMAGMKEEPSEQRARRRVNFYPKGTHTKESNAQLCE